MGKDNEISVNKTNLLLMRKNFKYRVSPKKYSHLTKNE